MASHFSLNEQGCASFLRAVCELSIHNVCPFSLELLVLILRASFFDKSCQCTLVCDLSLYFAYGSLCRKLKKFIVKFMMFYPIEFRF